MSQTFLALFNHCFSNTFLQEQEIKLYQNVQKNIIQVLFGCLCPIYRLFELTQLTIKSTVSLMGCGPNNLPTPLDSNFLISFWGIIPPPTSRTSSKPFFS